MRINKRIKSELKKEASVGGCSDTAGTAVLELPGWLRALWMALAHPVLWAAPKTRSSFCGFSPWAASLCLNGNICPLGTCGNMNDSLHQLPSGFQNTGVIQQRWIFSLGTGQVWHRQARWPTWWISSICYSPLGCVELLLFVCRACFARACSKIVKPIFRCRQLKIPLHYTEGKEDFCDSDRSILMNDFPICQTVCWFWQNVGVSC